MRSILSMALVLVLALASPSLAGVVYSEDFEDGVADNITVIYPSFEIALGLRGSNFGFRTPDGPGIGQTFRIDGIPSDITSIEFDFVLEDGGVGDLGVMFNTIGVLPLGGGTQGYGVGIHPAGSDSSDVIFKALDGVGTLLHPRQSGVISANRAYRLRVDHIGDEISAYLDGVLYMRGVDPGPRLQGGSTFIRIFGRGTIDNITISAVPEPSTLISCFVGGATCGLVFLRRRTGGRGMKRPNRPAVT